MPDSKPYQPSLLRFLHGINALIALLAIITSFWVYNTFDGRLIKLPLPEINDIIGIHGTFGLAFLLLMPAFALYSFHVGHKRLVQSDSLAKLRQIGKPIWWYSLHRMVNTVMLIAATWALITGRMMKRNTVLIIAEILVMGGILTAFIAPLLSPSDESSEVG